MGVASGRAGGICVRACVFNSFTTAGQKKMSSWFVLRFLSSIVTRHILYSHMRVCDRVGVCVSAHLSYIRDLQLSRTLLKSVRVLRVHTHTRARAWNQNVNGKGFLMIPGGRPRPRACSWAIPQTRQTPGKMHAVTASPLVTAALSVEQVCIHSAHLSQHHVPTADRTRSLVCYFFLIGQYIPTCG